MSNSESQNRKGKGGRKPKFDYTSEDFLSLVESYAKKGFTDKEIAHAIGLSPQKFSEKKSTYSELSDVLSRARCTINSLVRAKFLAMALGCIITMKTGEKLNASKMKMPTSLQILTTVSLLILGLKTS